MSASADKRPLWAPWRIEYIRRLESGEEDHCFLCETGQTPAADEANFVVARSELCFVILNRYPYNAGHVLVAPRRHVGDLDGLSVAERAELFELLVRAEQALKAGFAPHGFNMGCNIGLVAGAAVADHVHLHLVPRWTGDTNFMPVLANTDCIPLALTEAAKLLREHWPEPEA